MRIALPTQESNGLESQLFGHFGSASRFVIVETASGASEVVENSNQQHLHGQCQPLQALGGKPVDAVVVGGIGLGALLKLQAAGIRVYRGVEGTVRENVALIQSGRLPEFSSDQTCAGHGSHGGCGH
ncbi:MAG: NifB/NifX family molybdenum-iron cluster-binding protein [bacterium]